MRVEEELLRQLGTKNEQSRDIRENMLYSLLSEPHTPRLDLDQGSKIYNRLQAKNRWDDFARNELDCTPLWPGVWAEWRDGNMRDARVGCALIMLPEEAAFTIANLNLARVGSQLMAEFVTTLADGRLFILPMDILAVIDRQGSLLGYYPLFDDKTGEQETAALRFNFGSNLLLTTLLGVSRVRSGAAKRSTDGQVLSA